MTKFSDQQGWPHVLAALEALEAGDGDRYDTHLAVGGREALRTLGTLAIVFIRQVCQHEELGSAGELLADMREHVHGRLVP